jgi:starch synthase (maltosyl-transferring)
MTVSSESPRVVVRSIPDDGRVRAVVAAITPQVDGGRFPIKRTVGEPVVVEADVFADGHDALAVVLAHRPPGAPDWSERPMHPLGNDRWRGEFVPVELGRHEYAVVAWVDRFMTWRQDFEKRVAAGQDVSVDLRVGAGLIVEAAARASDPDAGELRRWATRLEGSAAASDRVELALGTDLTELMATHPDRRFASRGEPELAVIVEPERARFSTWYELFPRSASPDPGRHGTLRDVIDRLGYVGRLGFDVLYLPPIHPIGRTFRKGPNNIEVAAPGDPGVPWAIGGTEGGHTAIHQELGTIDDFRELVAAADRHGVQVALDLAFQASPDHPFVEEHRDWFRSRPDGTIQYAENPPKKYQDIYPFDFESDDWAGLWAALLEVVRFWIGNGVRIFRVDNPHTKPFRFWDWLIAEVRRDDPDVLFLAEAFTRPKVMYRLAKGGFSQSYTYFTWRTTKDELTSYFTELTRTDVREFFRPNVWPNTPDILHEVLQHGGRPAFQSRFILAATLAASYGIYGPAFELGEHVPREPGSEEYLDSEKYQQRTWDLDHPDSLAPLIGRLNRIRREHPALQSNDGLTFHATDDDQVLAYSKTSRDRSDTILAVVSLDPVNVRTATVELDLEALGIEPGGAFEAVDLLGDKVNLWHGARNRIRLDPSALPGTVLQLRPGRRSEREFEYYL